jgi:HSP20 family protein
MTSKNWPLLSLFDEDSMLNWPVMQQLSALPTALSSSDVSVWEEEDKVVVEAVLPGIKKEEIDVTFEKGVLTIRANQKEQEEDKKKKYFRKRNLSFIYRLSVPGHLDESQEPRASINNGIMRIEFSKQKREQPKKIAVK